MKKIICMALSIVLAASLVACGSEQDETKDSASVPTEELETSPVTGNICGGWTVNEDLRHIAIPQDANTAFVKASQSYDDSELETIALVASRDEGESVRYAILCSTETVSCPPMKVLVMVYVDAPKNGEPTIDKVREVDLNYIEEDQIDLDGEQGWEKNTDFTPAEITPETSEIFDRATNNFVGAKLDPLVLLRTQVVSGINYAYLCKSTIDGDEPVITLNVVIVYNDLQNEASVTTNYILTAAEYDK